MIEFGNWLIRLVPKAQILSFENVRSRPSKILISSTLDIMATALQGFSRVARGCQCRCGTYYSKLQLIGQVRTLSVSAIRTKDAAEDTVDPNKELVARAQALGLRITRRLPRLQESDPRGKKPKQTFMNMGEPEPFEDDFPEEEEDDISTIGHQELEHHREMREYARLAAWEMPLLASMDVRSCNPGGRC